MVFCVTTSQNLLGVHRRFGDCIRLDVSVRIVCLADRCVKLTPHPHLLSRLRISGVFTPFVPSWPAQGHIYLTVVINLYHHALSYRLPLSKPTEVILFTILAPTNAQFYILCILLLICSYMFRCNRHPQGAYTSVVKTYSNKKRIIYVYNTKKSFKRTNCILVNACIVHSFKRVSSFKRLLLCYKGKAVPLQAWSGPEGSRKLRFPDFMITAQDGGKVVSLTHRPPLPSGNTPGTHSC